MGKPFIKIIAVSITALAALVICFVGVRVNKQQQYQQRVDNAQTAIENEKTNVSSLSEQINSLYANEEKIFLKPDITDAELSNLTTKLAEIKVDAGDFGIEDTAMPAEAAELKAEKEELDQRLKDVQSKMNMQQATANLFTEGVSNWLEAVNDVIIKEDLQETGIGAVREQLALFDDTPWRKMIQDYLDFATAQVTRSQQLEETFTSMLQDGVVTANVTYEGYLAALDSISQVRNPVLKEKYTQLAATVATQMGYTTTSTTAATESIATYEETNVEPATESTGY